MQDFVDPTSCGVANPVANLGQLGQGGRQEQQFQGVDPMAKAMGMGPAGPGMMEQMRPGMMGPQADHFAQQFQQGGRPAPGMMGPEMMMHGQFGDSNELANQFTQMNMTQQQVEFERVHADQKNMGGAWMNEMDAQSQGGQWGNEMTRQHAAHGAPQSAWASEFQQAGPMGQMGGGPMARGPMMKPNPMMMRQGMPMQPMMGNMMGMGNMMQMGGPMMGQMGQMNMQQMPVQQAPVQQEPEAIMKEPIVDQPAMGMGMTKEMIDSLMNSGQDKWKNSKFLKFINKVQKGEIEFKDNQAIEKPVALAEAKSAGEDWAAEFDVSQGEKSFIDQYESEIKEANPEARKWMQEMQQNGGAGMGDMKQWMDQFANEQKDGLDWAKELSTTAAVVDPTYSFAEENKYMDNADPYQEGLRLLQLGRLREAITAFEAAVQQSPDNADAWRYLGQAQAENEDERNAIAALLKCVDLDPYNLPALLMLGVSYTNDLEESRALGYLKRWMLNNPDYQGTEVEEQSKQIEEYEQMYGGDSGSLDRNMHDEVTKMFMKATTINPNDADVYTVLGVLHHISGDFSQAIEAFRQAVTINPSDPTLWNKLGATQANSQKSSEAVGAYKKALQLRPTYVRALANLAIAFANQGLHEDAVRTYLATLKQNPQADHVWSYLRISLSNMDRPDLVRLTEQKNVDAFREHFKF